MKNIQKIRNYIKIRALVIVLDNVDLLLFGFIINTYISIRYNLTLLNTRVLEITEIVARFVRAQLSKMTQS